ncbi:hypothetical protein ABBQ32_005549 [Trebouxia sp. C0010 RCD-2024]
MSSPPQSSWQDVCYPADEFFRTLLSPQHVKVYPRWLKHIKKQRTAQFEDVIKEANFTSLVHINDVTTALSMPPIDPTDLQTAFQVWGRHSFKANDSKESSQYLHQHGWATHVCDGIFCLMLDPKKLACQIGKTAQGLGGIALPFHGEAVTSSAGSYPWHRIIVAKDPSAKGRWCALFWFSGDFQKYKLCLAWLEQQWTLLWPPHRNSH